MSKYDQPDLIYTDVECNNKINMEDLRKRHRQLLDRRIADLFVTITEIRIQMDKYKLLIMEKKDWEIETRERGRVENEEASQRAHLVIHNKVVRTYNM